MKPTLLRRPGATASPRRRTTSRWRCARPSTGIEPVAAAGVAPFVFLLAVFLMACFVGYYVVWNVTPALHSPLMAVTNAISSVIIVGAMLAAGFAFSGWSVAFGFIAVLLASRQHLRRLRRDAAHAGDVPGARRSRSASMPATVTALLYLVAAILFILALRGLSSPVTSRRGNRFGMAGMVIAILATLAQTA